jgi:N,N'-diacetyllegionaminate synthase
MAELGSPWSGAHGPLLIAEIGGNHEGDFAYARRLTELAISSGADTVKFQLYRGDTLVNARESPDRHRHFHRFELQPEHHLELAGMCRAAGVGYLASVWDLEMLDWIDPHLSIYKIGSGDLTAYPLLREFARRGKPMIVSTGLSTLEDVLASVAFVQSVDAGYRRADRLALLQCTSMYPIEDGDANLRVMDTLREATGLAVGYSDHTKGQAALFVAAARGADVLEFHFTDDRTGKAFRDHQVSLTPDEVRQFCADLDQMRVFLGDGVKRPLPSEIETGHVTSFRRAVYCRHGIRQGQVISADDLVVLRPNHGVDARQFDELLGRRAARDLQALERIEVA